MNPDVERLMASFDAAKLDSAEEVQRVVDNASKSNRAILFINVDWAFMEHQKTRFADFVSRYHKTNSKELVHFHFVDCTSASDYYRPLSSLPGWKQLEKAAGTGLIQGWGELVWMEKGRVLYVEKILNFETTEELIQKTKSVFKIKN